MKEMSSAPNIERLYDDHASALFAFLLNLLRNEADMRDVLQGDWVWQHPGGIEPFASGQTYPNSAAKTQKK